MIAAEFKTRSIKLLD